MNATEKILSVYDKEELKEIADHGCQSGVCSEHIYYADTISFYEEYEDELLDYITDNYGFEHLVKFFEESSGSLRHYKNSIVWCFIEMIAFEAVEDHNHEYATAV